ncbi:uncharacterized protein BO95DRAFT_460321 [Aspergillus brunneoviolaceus CBS 621.78]|uniref:Uncharacterized protein n=1 Tax=Aspergillus brunneoviolaceus CBS 621.78 TaxID=1450534 RepID=A0ACD1GJG2_9EURO|nr:hypothetical protein BO95DRAFT_460321 [Aspergillus brunneoviolaceus CBS 621.78]RAH49293.1 hypothetical protein BO95DRAFT_460321 [Aspergillus brunneoviolaceus CBS 621.78]
MTKEELVTLFLRTSRTFDPVQQTPLSVEAGPSPSTSAALPGSAVPRRLEHFESAYVLSGGLEERVRSVCFAESLGRLFGRQHP